MGGFRAWGFSRVLTKLPPSNSLPVQETDTDLQGSMRRVLRVRGPLTLKVYPVKASEVIVKVLDKKTVDRVWADFEAWRAAQ